MIDFEAKAVWVQDEHGVWHEAASGTVGVEPAPTVPASSQVDEAVSPSREEPLCIAHTQSVRRVLTVRRSNALTLAVSPFSLRDGGAREEEVVVVVVMVVVAIVVIVIVGMTVVVMMIVIVVMIVVVIGIVTTMVQIVNDLVARIVISQGTHQTLTIPWDLRIQKGLSIPQGLSSPMVVVQAEVRAAVLLSLPRIGRDQEQAVGTATTML